MEPSVGTEKLGRNLQLRIARAEKELDIVFDILQNSEQIIESTTATAIFSRGCLFLHSTSAAAGRRTILVLATTG